MPGHPVALTEFGSGLRPLIIVHLALDDPLILVVVVLELAWRMKLQHAGNLRARVAEGVVDASWLEDERASPGDGDLAADVKGQLTLNHEGALVLASVGVWGDHVAGRDARLDARKRAAKALRSHLVGYAQDGKVGAFIRTDQELLGLVHRHGILPFRLRNGDIVPLTPGQAHPSRFGKKGSNAQPPDQRHLYL